MIPLLILHSFGLALGLGGATILDLLILRSLHRPLEPHLVHVVTTVSKIVASALALLWASGLGFLFVYKSVNPGLLENPKLWAKMAIVAVLTVNGVYLHARVLPVLRAQSGRMLFEGVPVNVRVCMLTAGTVSIVSWYFPFLLGIVRQFNFAASFQTFLAAYMIVLVVVWTATQSIGFTISALMARSHLPSAKIADNSDHGDWISTRSQAGSLGTPSTSGRHDRGSTNTVHSRFESDHEPLYAPTCSDRAPDPASPLQRSRA